MINDKKFILLNESLKAIKKSCINLLIVKGEAGTGKSRTILDSLKKDKVDFNYFSSYTTKLAFYKILYENKDKEVLVFDDTQGINDLSIISMIKSLCWSPDNLEREVCYFSTSEKMEKLDLPGRFKTKAKIILIFNEDLRGFEPIVNRGICINFNFNFKEKINVFNEMKDKANIDSDVLKWVKSNCNEGTENLSLRSLVILSNLKREGFDFKIFADEILKNDDEFRILLDCLKKNELVENACSEWCLKVGKSRRSFFRLKRMLK